MSLRIVIADDSAFFREVLKEELESEGDIRVVGEAADGAELVEKVERTGPDLVTVDIRMPGMGGLAAIEELMARRPVPIVVITSQPIGSGSTLVFEATRRGALEVLEKGVVARDAPRLRERLRRLARVAVVRHPRATPAPRPAEPAPARSYPIVPAGRRRLVAIGASAGGPPAVAELLSALPADFPACIAIVQHLSLGFVQSYVRFLQQSTALSVRVADGPCAIQAGHVFVAPDDRHLVVQGVQLVLSSAPPDNGLRPSVDALFSSLAALGRNAVGVVLSGMGEDGALGAGQLAAAGGLVIAQDEETSTIFGMPRAAASAAAGAFVLPIHQMGAALVRATSRAVAP